MDKQTVILEYGADIGSSISGDINRLGSVPECVATGLSMDLFYANVTSSARAMTIVAHGFSTATFILTTTDIRQQSIAERFRALAEQWHEETGMLSSPTQIVNNSAYLSIIAMGDVAISFILHDLREVGGYWYPALRALTGASPVPEEARGRPQLMKEAWLAWGRQYGYIE